MILLLKNQSFNACSLSQNKNSKKFLEALFDDAYFNSNEADNKLAIEFYGKEAILNANDLEEDCIIEGPAPAKRHGPDKAGGVQQK